MKNEINNHTHGKLTKDHDWNLPDINIEDVIPGDMPGDKVKIDDTHIKRAAAIFPFLLNYIQKSQKGKTVISVYGGSGVGKSEIGSLIAHFFKLEGHPSYVLSGDNYPFRIPEDNDRERLKTFRYAGLKAVAEIKEFTDEWIEIIRDTWKTMEDADPDRAENTDYFKIYQMEGSRALSGYLGSEAEFDFSLLNSIIRKFKNGSSEISLKRMGRTSDELWFNKVDFRDTEILVIEWTHGNNPALQGVDLPVYLFSTPEETLAHRMGRGRDKGVDSPFTQIVLEIEQKKLNSQAEKAALITAKNSEIISFNDFQQKIDNPISNGGSTHE